MMEWIIFIELSIILCLILYASNRVARRIKKIKRSYSFFEFNTEGEKIWRKENIIVFQLLFIPLYIAFFFTIIGAYFDINSSLRYFISINLAYPYLSLYLFFYDKLLIYNNLLVAFNPFFINKRLDLSDIEKITRLRKRDEIKGILKYFYSPEKTLLVKLKTGRKLYICIKEIEKFMQVMSEKGVT